MKIQIELKENWLSESQANDMGFLLGQVRERFERDVFDKAVEKAVKGLKIPKIKISAKEIKNKVLELLAEKVIEDRNI